MLVANQLDGIHLGVNQLKKEIIRFFSFEQRTSDQIREHYPEVLAKCFSSFFSDYFPSL